MAGEMIRLHAANLAPQATRFPLDAVLEFVLLDQSGQALAKSVEVVAPGRTATLEFMAGTAGLFRAEVRSLSGGAAFISAVEVVDSAGRVQSTELIVAKSFDKSSF